MAWNTCYGKHERKRTSPLVWCGPWALSLLWSTTFLSWDSTLKTELQTTTAELSFKLQAAFPCYSRFPCKSWPLVPCLCWRGAGCFRQESRYELRLCAAKFYDFRFPFHWKVYLKNYRVSYNNVSHFCTKEVNNFTAGFQSFIMRSDSEFNGSQ